VPEHKAWASRATDVCFAFFATFFFVTRLVIFPRYCVYSLIFEAPAVFGMWGGFWPNFLLYGTLQLLHVFWFVLILKMAYKIVTVGEVEKDVRSDDEGEEEQVGLGVVELHKSPKYVFLSVFLSPPGAKSVFSTLHPRIHIR
jgi:uncharacterized membrane protein